MKCIPLRQHPGHVIVAPCAGAWIEISPIRRLASVAMSPPARGRGLK